jgi:hypothetical protein
MLAISFQRRVMLEDMLIMLLKRTLFVEHRAVCIAGWTLALYRLRNFTYDFPSLVTDSTKLTNPLEGKERLDLPISRRFFPATSKGAGD